MAESTKGKDFVVLDGIEIPRDEYDDMIRDFESAASRPLEAHVNNSFFKTYKPVMDDASFRSFDTMEEYRRWCEESLPSWLGYSRDV